MLFIQTHRLHIIRTNARSHRTHWSSLEYTSSELPDLVRCNFYSGLLLQMQRGLSVCLCVCLYVSIRLCL